MRHILCSECTTTNAPYVIQANSLFGCTECPRTIHPRDIDLDGHETWTVSPLGALGYVIDPAHCLTLMAEALDDYMSSSNVYSELTALQDHRDAAMALVTALECGLLLPSQR
ncbi:hypothetical protein PUR28_01295 [Streptomyces sp. BE308]|uniref:hypothetical protein n=1 Tax=Streptomyces sp. BE308 TaxID=3002529 RepID=UPI002E7654E9|nr:hypothetical protein [Streptomyces sp. BE308]MEE1789426.1 hypothetical protein [Streptomyces sp. BE308]